MSTIVFLTDYRNDAKPRQNRPPAKVTFTRQELNALFNTYSRRVASGEWKDYAISQDGPMAIFSIFRRSSEQPLYAIVKKRASSQGRASFMIYSEGKILLRKDSLSSVLSYLAKPSLITSKQRR